MIEWYFNWDEPYKLSYIDIDCPWAYQERRKKMSKHGSNQPHNGLNASKGRSTTTNSGKPKN